MDAQEKPMTARETAQTNRSPVKDFQVSTPLQDHPPKDEDEDEVPSLGETCCFLIFAAIFAAVLLNQLVTDNSYFLAATVRDVLIKFESDEGSISEIKSHDEARAWLVHHFIPTLDQTESYGNMPNYEEDTMPRFSWFNRIITPLRFFQKRVQLVENTSSRTSDLYPEIWEVSSITINEKDAEGESTEKFKTVAGELCQGLTDDVFVHDSEQGFDHAGGYQFIVDLKSTSDSASGCVKILLEDHLWIDTSTAALGVDFVMYNAHYDLLTYVVIELHFSSGGRVDGAFNVRSIKTMYYWTLLDYFRAGLEVLYVCLVFYYTFIEIFEFKSEFEIACYDELHRRKLEREELFSNNSAETEEKLNFLEKVKIFFTRVVPGHMNQVWNMIDVTSLVLSYAAIIVWVNVITTAPGEDAEPDDTLIEAVHEAVGLLAVYVRIAALNLLLIFFRVIKYLRRFERVRLLQQTFQRAGSEIFYFFILLMAIFFAFVIFALVAFGNNNVHYFSVLPSLTSNLLLLLNSIDFAAELLDSHFIMATVYIIIFTLLINFILTNMFIAIISTAYGAKLEEFYEKKKHSREVAENVHVCTQLKQHFYDTALKVMGKCCKKRTLKRKYKKKLKELQEQHDDKNERVDNYELEYVQVKLWSTGINPEILSDKEKKVKVAEKSQTLSRQLCSAIIFVVFTVIYISVLIQQQDVPQKFALTTTLGQSTRHIAYSRDLQLDDVNSFSTNAEWLEHGFSESMSLQNHLNYVRGNYVVGQELLSPDFCTSDEGPLRLTVRRVETEDNPSDIYSDYQPEMRASTFDAAEFSFNELTSSLDLLCQWEHQEDSGFLQAGGYSFHFELDKFDEGISELIENDKFFNDTVNSATLSYVVFNPDVTYFTYIGLSFGYDSSGVITHDQYIVPMLFKLYEPTPSNVFRAILECVFVVLLIYHICLSGKTIYNDYKNYEHWRRRFYGILTAEQISKRNRAKPEWLRRVTNILTPYVLVDLLSYTCSVVCITYWLKYMMDPATGTTLPVENGDFHDEFADQAETIETYLNWSAFNVFLLFVRILNYLTIKKGLRFLQDTVNRSMSDILYFLLMLLIILTGYVFMGYLSFGYALENYSTISKSFITCFSIIIGDFDYEELESVDILMSFLFFFTLAFLATYILLNIFIAILERAFNMVKEEAGRAQETTYFSFFLGLLKKSVVQIFKRPQRDIKERLNAELAADLFKRLDTGDEIQNYPSIWGAHMADEILMEQSKREEVFQPLEELFQKRKDKEIEDIQLLFTDKQGLADELEARVTYWNYLRVGILKLSGQHAKLSLRRQELAHQKEELMPTYDAQRQSLEDYKSQISIAQTDLDEKKTKLSYGKSSIATTRK